MELSIVIYRLSTFGVARAPNSKARKLVDLDGSLGPCIFNLLSYIRAQIRTCHQIAFVWPWHHSAIFAHSMAFPAVQPQRGAVSKFVSNLVELIYTKLCHFYSSPLPSRLAGMSVSHRKSWPKYSFSPFPVTPSISRPPRIRLSFHGP